MSYNRPCVSRQKCFGENPGETANCRHSDFGLVSRTRSRNSLSLPRSRPFHYTGPDGTITLSRTCGHARLTRWPGGKSHTSARRDSHHRQGFVLNCRRTVLALGSIPSPFAPHTPQAYDGCP